MKRLYFCLLLIFLSPLFAQDAPLWTEDLSARKGDSAEETIARLKERLIFLDGEIGRLYEAGLGEADPRKSYDLFMDALELARERNGIMTELTELTKRCSKTVILTTAQIEEKARVALARAED